MEEQDLHLLPFWLQKHALAFGVGDLPQRSDEFALPFLTKEETEGWLDLQADWFRAEFCGPDAFFRLSTGLPIHQLTLRGRWDDECRARMEELVRSDAGIEQFALVFFGGNLGTESEALEKLMAVSLIRERAQERLRDLEAAGGAHPTIVHALKRCGGDAWA